jgi:hypothetical protein
MQRMSRNATPVVLVAIVVLVYIVTILERM